MSKVAKKVVAPVSSVFNAVGDVTGLGRKKGDGGPADAGAPDTPASRASAELDTRESMLLAQARAGGAVRAENEADVLGYSPTAKRRSATRTLLG